MKRFTIALFACALMISGCAQNHFNIPAEMVAQKLKVIGVAPIMIDVDSDIVHPQKESVTLLVSDFNRRYEPLLASKIKETELFSAVNLMSEDSKQLFNILMTRREKRDDGGIQYNKYFWKSDEISFYTKKNKLDAVMLLVVSGITKPGKLYSSNLLTSLETNYNFLTITAQIVDPDGAVLWEYPNFRGHLSPHDPLINLQYADFSEAAANMSNKVELRFKSIDGIRRALEHKKKDLLFRETTEPEIYGRIFDDMVALIKYPVERKAAKPEIKPSAGELTPVSTTLPTTNSSDIPFVPALDPLLTTK